MERAITIWLIACFAIGCQNEDISANKEEKSYPFVIGSWLYTEYGYSPGAGYYTVGVPADPPQTVTFKSNLMMASTIDQFKKYRYYRLFQDTVLNEQVVAFFENNPGNESLDLAGLTPAYSIVWDGDDMELHYRWCIEGCHQKFKRLSFAEPE